MDPNIISIIVGLLTNGLCSLIAFTGDKVQDYAFSKEEIQERLLVNKKIKVVVEEEFKDLYNFLNPEDFYTFLKFESGNVEKIIVRIYSFYDIDDKNRESLEIVRKDFCLLCSQYFYDKVGISAAAPQLFHVLTKCCERSLDIMINEEGDLAAHEAQSKYRSKTIVEMLLKIIKKMQDSQDKLEEFDKEFKLLNQKYNKQIQKSSQSCHFLKIDPSLEGHFVDQSDEFEQLKSKNYKINNELKIYLNEIISDLNSIRELNYYIKIRCFDESYKEVKYVDKYVGRWIKDKSSQVLAILGDYGTGKTLYCQKLTLDLAEKYLQGVINSYVPILLYLRDMDDESCINDFFNKQLKSHAPFGTTIDYSYFNMLYQDGRLLFILDGFDEMSVDMRESTAYKNFYKIDKLALGKNKLIITSRTHYFKEKNRERDVLNPISKNYTGLRLKENINLQMVYIQLFNDADINEYFKKFFGNQSENQLERMSHIYNLWDLAHRPIFLSIIAQTLPKLEELKSTITIDKLYVEYVKMCIIREGWRDICSTDVYEIMEELALRMFIDGNSKVTSEQIFNLIKELNAKNAYNDIDLNNLDGKIRTCSFLNRTSSDEYTFFHKSLMEFFIAKKFVNEIKGNKVNSSSFGKRRISPTIGNFMKDLLTDKDALYAIIHNTKYKNFDEIGFLGGNSLTILGLMNENFSEKDFSSLVLSGAYLLNCDLIHTSFKNSILKDAEIINCNLTNADFTYTDLEGAIFTDNLGINCFVLSPDSKYFALGGLGGQIIICDMSTGSRLQSLYEHADRIIALCWPNNRLLISCGADKKIIIWDTYSWTISNVIKVEKNPKIIVWMKNTEWLLYTDHSGNIKAFDSKNNWNIVHDTNMHNPINMIRCFSKKDNILLSFNDHIAILDKNFKLVDEVSIGSPILSINNNENNVLLANNCCNGQCNFNLRDYFLNKDSDHKWIDYEVWLKRLSLGNMELNDLRYWSSYVHESPWILEGYGEDGEDVIGGTDGKDEIYSILDVCYLGSWDKYVILLYHYKYNIESWHNTSSHYQRYYLIFMNDAKEVKSFLVNSISYCNNDAGYNPYFDSHIKYVIFSEKNYLVFAEYDEYDMWNVDSIHIWYVDTEFDEYREIRRFKMGITCNGMKIDNVYNLSNEQLKELKNGGAVTSK
ncbi:NACHT domain-containing protein [Methanosarcina vacuolata]|uniref:NACHT domain-containing protein n=1 Tax=Methanosarcina vacuolata Z-761 TaxID=1434123 RepID=A0A0E3Q8B7_9EURY|nr:NACHT domain-containing protein [Methanosarcina vacuolata]AKB45313.1 hypothetical protein MSVAZ_3044 [Methanosarcina vacuolata Z-761]